MIEKQEFYHGAALIKLLEHPSCRSIKKYSVGYLLNEKTFIFLKYSTKSRSPWRFSFGSDELGRLASVVSNFPKTVIGFVCGGDGICAIPHNDYQKLIGGVEGWISVKRGFGKCFAVAGSHGKLGGKVALRRWPQQAFEENAFEEQDS